MFRANLKGLVKALFGNIDLLQRLNTLKPGCLLEMVANVFGTEEVKEKLENYAEVQSPPSSLHCRA